ncbi:unnamed protein product [Bursaphelenchus okinawaensis]|uniref:BTB domain-containing protein n=1 Tax=Bursaphelenchus okinawaensis TaxID=465554 RepID=A0A811JUX1_9BILA|nr:unnamed protein product [Bursaphelenchus okinawaensis]CAG9084397.1 unnamed protein product [Bursaphelenchus okinawaensis]
MSNPSLIAQNQKAIQERILCLQGRLAEIVEHKDGNNMFNQSEFSDFKVKVGKTNTKTYFVSRFLMAQRSSVFQTMFKTQFKEVMDEEMEIKADVNAVEAMLLFIHQNKKVENVDLAMKVVQLAHLYEINLLQDQCELFLLENIKLKRAQECWTVADSLGMDYLAYKCVEVIYLNYRLPELKPDVKEQVNDVPVVKEIVFNKYDALDFTDLHLNGRKKLLVRLKNHMGRGDMHFYCGFRNDRQHNVAKNGSDVEILFDADEMKTKYAGKQDFVIIWVYSYAGGNKIIECFMVYF